MKMQMRNCIIISEDGNNYMVRRSDLFLFIWRVGFKRHFRTLRATHLDRETALYASPKVQLQAIERVAQTPGQYSMEERMGCGFGACMGCTIQTRSGPRRVCKDGPVFDRGEVIL